MQSTFDVKTAIELVNLTLSGKLNPDPISQRSAVSSGPKKSQEIISAILDNLGVGMITLRDISNDPGMQKVYPGVKYLVIDGGHRIRAMVYYYTNLIVANGSYFKENSNPEKFLNFKIPVESIVCTSSEATHVFKARNKTTSVNFMEMIMCDDESAICKEVRSRTKFYKEYNNSVHPVFSVITKDGQTKPEYFDTDVNPRRKWDEYVFIALLKVLGGGNVDAGQREIEAMIENEQKGVNPLSKQNLSVVDRFFNDVVKFKINRGKKLNGDIFAAFQVVWFALYEKNPPFVISHPELFQQRFMYAYTKLTGTSDTEYNNKIVNVGTEEEQELVNLKEYVRSHIVNFSNSHVQKICARFILNEMGDFCGVTFREEKRSVSTKVREELLANQNYTCAIDGMPLTLDDSVLGHDTPWAQGGKLKDGAVIRKKHNINMGSTTISEYRFILMMKGEPIAEHFVKDLTKVLKKEVA